MEAQVDYSLLVLLFGLMITGAILFKSVSKKLNIPALVGFILLGFLIKVTDMQWGLLNEPSVTIFEFLGEIGVALLLFQIGLSSHVKGLLKALKSAAFIWLINVTAAAGAGFAVSYYLLGMEWIPSVFVAIALAATSVGVSVSPWKEMDALDKKEGQIMLDTAELDDISSIILMALLFSIAPLLHTGTAKGNLAGILMQEGGWLILKLILFTGACILISEYVERPLTSFFQKFERYPDPIITIIADGLIIAALAGLLGFSIAIGAFFAGLVYSRDKKVVMGDSSFQSVYDLFTPFFFIMIGFHLAPDSLISGMSLGIFLLLAALIGKLAGVSLPALSVTSAGGALLLGVSMVPRAEVAMIVMQKGLNMGSWAVPQNLYSGMVLVTAVTCIFSPILVKWMIGKEYK